MCLEGTRVIDSCLEFHSPAVSRKWTELSLVEIGRASTLSDFVCNDWLTQG
jgi:hypothetical protein